MTSRTPKSLIHETIRPYSFYEFLAFLSGFFIIKSLYMVESLGYDYNPLFLFVTIVLLLSYCMWTRQRKNSVYHKYQRIPSLYESKLSDKRSEAATRIFVYTISIYIIILSIAAIVNFTGFYNLYDIVRLFLFLNVIVITASSYIIVSELMNDRKPIEFIDSQIYVLEWVSIISVSIYILSSFYFGFVGEYVLDYLLAFEYSFIDFISTIFFSFIAYIWSIYNL